MLLLVLNLLAAFKTLGTLMAVGLMILPATAARYWANTITQQLLLGFAFFSLASCWIGLTSVLRVPRDPVWPCDCSGRRRDFRDFGCSWPSWLRRAAAQAIRR